MELDQTNLAFKKYDFLKSRTDAILSYKRLSLNVLPGAAFVMPGA